MSERFFIKPDTYPPRRYDWLRWNSVQKATLDTGSLPADELSTLAQKAGNTPLILILPGQQIRTLYAPLPARKRSLLASLPYIIEESLATPIEQMHVAHGQFQGNGIQTCALPHTQLTDWLARFQRAGLKPGKVLVDHQLLHTSGEYIWQESEHLLIATNQLQASIQPQALAHLLPRLELNDTVHCYGNSSVPVGNLTMQPAPSSLLEHLASHFNPATALDLLQGTYQQESPIKRQLNIFKWPAIALGGLCCLLLGSLLLDNLRLANEVNVLNNAIEQTYREAFPDVRNVRNPVRQMKGYLSQQGSNQGDTHFLSLLAPVSKALTQHGIRLINLRYSDSPPTLRLQLEASDFNAIEQASSQLKQAGLASSVGTLTKNPQGVSGLLTITGNP